MNKKLIIVFIVAFLVRLINLNQSLWLDEAITARVIQEYSHWEIITKFSPFDFHPPLYYLFMKSWSLFFGFSEIALRMPSIIFSLLTGYVIFKIAKLLHGYIVAMYASAFFLFNPLIVYYSQEARPYMMTTFLLTTSLFYLIKILQVQSSKFKVQNQNLKLKIDLFLFNAFIVLSLFTFYGSIFLVVTYFLYFIYKKQYKYLFICLFVVFAYFLLISPLLLKQLINAKVSLALVKNWGMTLGKANIKNLLLIPVKFSIGRIDFYPKWIYYTVAGIWTGFIIVQSSLLRQGYEGQAKLKVQSSSLKFKVNNFLIFLLFVPLFLGFVVSFVTPMLQYFRFLYLIPIMSILLSFGALDQNKFHRLGVRVVLGGLIVFSLIYLLIPRFHREDWKTFVKNLPENQSIYMIASSADPIKYYNPELRIKDLRSLSSSSSLSSELIIIPYTSEIYGYNYQETLLRKKYKLLKKIAFRNLYLEEWNKH